MYRRSVILALVIVVCITSIASAEVTLRFMTWGGPIEDPIVTAQLEAWSKVRPDIKVEWVSLPFNQFEPTLKTRFAGGSAPDVFWIATEMGPRTFLRSGAIRNLQPFLDMETDDLLGLYREEVVKNITQDGNAYFMPFLGDNSILFYNKDVFDEAGVPYPPQTWDGNPQWGLNEFLDVAQKLTIDRDGDGINEVWGFLDFGQIINAEYTVYGFGGHLIPQGAQRVNINTPEAIEALRLMQDLRLKHKVSPGVEAVATRDLSERFMAGNVAMAVMWSAHAQRFVDVDFNWGLAQLPELKRRGGATWHSFMGMSRDTKYPEEAWELIKFLTVGEGQCISAGMGFEAPLADIPEIRDSYMTRVAVPEGSAEAILDNAKYSLFRYPIEGAAEVYRLFNEGYLQELLMGEISAEEAAELLQEETDFILEKFF